MGRHLRCRWAQPATVAQTGRVSRFGEADGLPANLIYGLVGDVSGNLWMSSNRGLSRFDPKHCTFRIWDCDDGLQADEFNGGSYHRSRSGELFFGGINGFNAFFPDDLEESSFEPNVVLTDFRLAGQSLGPGETVNRRVPLARSLTIEREIRLDYRDRVFSFGFAALDFSNPRKNRYAFRMVGFDREWNVASASHRRATYTNLPPGKYRFEVRGTNSDGVWSRHRARIRVLIAPPIWSTWWFRSLSLAAFVGAVARSYRHRVETIRLATELDAAREAQRSIWPQEDPRLPGFEISATSLPASEVGGDFFDFVWLDEARESLCLAIGDVAGKGMVAAMSAVMASGLISSAMREQTSLGTAISGINRIIFRKSSASRFVALCLVRLDARTRKLRYVNAGLAEPLLKSNGSSRFLPTADPRFPLGIHEEEAYREESVSLAAGDILVLYTDGVAEALNPDGEPFGYAQLSQRLEALPTVELSARQIRDELYDEVFRFSKGQPQQDDMTVIVVKSLDDPQSKSGGL